MTSQEIYRKVQELTDKLENSTNLRRNTEIERTKAYYEGYSEGYEDFRRMISSFLIESPSDNSTSAWQTIKCMCDIAQNQNGLL